MRREEAEAEARRLVAEHPDRERYRWFAREDDGGDWAVVRVAALPGSRIDPLTAEIRADEKPPTPDDPRTSWDRNMGGPWVGPG